MRGCQGWVRGPRVVVLGEPWGFLGVGQWNLGGRGCRRPPAREAGVPPAGTSVGARSATLRYYIYWWNSVWMFVHANEKFLIKFPKVFKFFEKFPIKVSGKFPILPQSFWKFPTNSKSF